MQLSPGQVPPVRPSLTASRYGDTIGMSLQPHGQNVLGEVDSCSGEPLGPRPHIVYAVSHLFRGLAVNNTTENPHCFGKILEIFHRPIVKVLIGLQAHLILSVDVSSKSVKPRDSRKRVPPRASSCVSRSEGACFGRYCHFGRMLTSELWLELCLLAGSADEVWTRGFDAKTTENISSVNNYQGSH